MARSKKGARRYNISHMGEQVGHLIWGGLFALRSCALSGSKSCLFALPGLALAIGVIVASVFAMNRNSKPPETWLHPPLYRNAQNVRVEDHAGETVSGDRLYKVITYTTKDQPEMVRQFYEHVCCFITETNTLSNSSSSSPTFRLESSSGYVINVVILPSETEETKVEVRTLIPFCC